MSAGPATCPELALLLHLVSNFDLIAGIAAHDVYHAGQVQLLKRLSGQMTSR